MFFTSAGHKSRFVAAMQQIGKVYDGKLDPEYGAALYILTASAGTWSKAESYVSSDGIGIATMLEGGAFGGGHSVLIQLAGNLFNGEEHIDPLEFLRLDDGNFQVALTAIIVRRSSIHIDGL